MKMRGSKELLPALKWGVYGLLYIKCNEAAVYCDYILRLIVILPFITRNKSVTIMSNMEILIKG